MKKIINLLTIIIPILMTISLISGCTTDPTTPKHETVYFQRGVYKSSSPDSSYIDFYVFYDETSGHTEDSEKGIGLPFSCVQINNNARFRFGGSEEPEEILTIKSVDNQKITGSFDDGKLLTFEYIPNANPDKFDAIEYIKKQN